MVLRKRKRGCCSNEGESSGRPFDCSFQRHNKACFEGNPFKTVPGPFKLFWECMRSKPGEEPTQPFYYLPVDPPAREVKLE